MGTKDMAEGSGREISPICEAIDPDWLCAVALHAYGWGLLEQLATASLAWLPNAPASDALYHLADDALGETTRSEDVWAWVDAVFADLRRPKPSPDDFRWIATYCMIQRPWSVTDAEDLIRFLSSLAFRADREHDLDEWNLLSMYRLYDFEMDDGLELDRAKILEEFRRRTEPLMLEQFTQHFRSSLDSQWVLEVLPPDGT